MGPAQGQIKKPAPLRGSKGLVLPSFTPSSLSKGGSEPRGHHEPGSGTGPLAAPGSRWG